MTFCFHHWEVLKACGAHWIYDSNGYNERLTLLWACSMAHKYSYITEEFIFSTSVHMELVSHVSSLTLTTPLFWVSPITTYTGSKYTKADYKFATVMPTLSIIMTETLHTSKHNLEQSIESQFNPSWRPANRSRPVFFHLRSFLLHFACHYIFMAHLKSSPVRVSHVLYGVIKVNRESLNYTVQRNLTQVLPLKIHHMSFFFPCCPFFLTSHIVLLWNTCWDFYGENGFFGNELLNMWFADKCGMNYNVLCSEEGFLCFLFFCIVWPWFAAGKRGIGFVLIESRQWSF